MTRRKLTPEEIALWQSVASKAERLHPDRPQPLPKPLPKPRPRKPHPVTGALGATGSPAPPKTGAASRPDRPTAVAPGMDRKKFGRMKRGKLAPEARLDLHGQRVASAHPALVRFILASQASGLRLVLVITGKGRDRDEPGPIPVPNGVLRTQVPQWLSMPPLAQAVLQVETAHVSHGGGGAYYVYLRRSR